MRKSHRKKVDIVKKRKTAFNEYRSHGWDREIRTPEMTGSEPVALPLGYIPMRIYYYMLNLNCCKHKFEKRMHRV